MASRLKEVLNLEIEKIKPSQEESKIIGLKTKEIVSLISRNLKKRKIKAGIFVGGSFAKDTLIKKEKYDVDIFVRFDKKYADRDENISRLLKNAVPKNAITVHGSRDYFRIRQGNIEFEIIPTLKIKNPSEEKNITDLSYFHVNYIKNKIKRNRRLGDEIRIAKAFLHYQNCYGAESYINGFSGYAVELLIVSYGSFVKFLESCLKQDITKGKMILDPERLYKNAEQIMREMNESKMNSPIILVDPTFRERNALAALSNETFEKFRHSAGKFLKNPSEKFFEFEDREKMLDKKYGNRLVKLVLSTEKQAGDIAGTKLKKFSNFFMGEISRYFDIKESLFLYDEKENKGKLMIACEQKKEIIFPGPPLSMKKELAAFRKEHRRIKTVKGRAFAYEKNNLDFKKFLGKFENEKSKIIEDMDVDSINLI